MAGRDDLPVPRVLLGAATALERGDVSVAISILTELVLDHPENAAAWCTLGAAYEQANRLDAAYQALQRAIQFSPSLAQAWLNLGLVSIRLHDYRGARRAFERLARLAPRDVRAWQGVCASALKLGFWAEAEQALKRARELGLPDEPWHRLSGQLLWGLGELPKAVGEFRASLHARLKHADPIVRRRESSPLANNHHVQQIQNLLWNTLQAMHQGGVHAIPFAGTLLGWVREGGLLPFDKDLDIAVPEVETHDASKVLVGVGWTPLVMATPSLNPLAFAHSTTGVTLDVVLLREDVDGWISGTWQRGIPWEWQRITRYPRFGWAEHESPAGKIWMPDRPEAVLEAVFGDWRTPDPDFDSIIAARNLQGYSWLTQCYLFSRILQRWGFGQYSKALANVEAGLRWLPGDDLLVQLRDRMAALLENARASQ